MDVALQSSVWVTSPEFSGWLIKRGFYWRKLWKKKWVALHGAEIVYMEKEPTVDNTSDMDITKAQLTANTTIDRDDLDGNPNGFAININDGHTPTWYLRAESLREKKSWLMRLGHVMAIVRWLEDFEKVRVLGVGGTGIVYELLHKTNGQRYAMKEMEIKNKAQMQMALSEAEMLKDIMENISHPNIMHIEKVFQVGSKFYLVFPLCTGGELYEHVIRRGHFTEQDAAVIIRDIVSGLHALHEHDILHLDIKPENILFDSDGPDARIKITDFGLSKVFSDIKEDKKTAPTAEELQEKLRALCESGVLNRDRLRGTVGYMSPELILAGYSAKATDVFAAGVVLYILLCGRPPFQSKSNREVLERTAKGLYRMDGPDWDCISEEAKDLVRKMLIVDPQQRITTKEILEHPFLRIEEEEPEAVAAALVASSGGEATGTATAPAVGAKTSSVSRGMTGGSKRSVNLNNALRLLSGHVSDLRTEKFAMSFTRLVSSLEGGPSKQGHQSMLYQLVVPLGKATGVMSASNKPPGAVAEEEMMMFQNPEIKQAIAAAMSSLGDEHGRLSVEQFMYILKHFAFTRNQAVDDSGAGTGEEGAESSTSSSSGAKGANLGTGLAMMLLCRFVDRDGDGMISADDVFTTQALVLQRSESFVKVIFRLYCETVWYPGRQLNFHQLQKAMHKQQTVGGSTAVLGGDVKYVDVVEPPKFITAKHVSVMFERLGFDGSGGQKIFAALCEALAKRKAVAGDAEIDDRNSLHNPPEPPEVTKSPNAAFAAALNVTDTAPTPPRKSVSNADITTPEAPATGTPSQLREGGYKPDGTLAKMDVNDFIKACELDDVLIQVLLNNLRGGLIGLIKKAENSVQQMGVEAMEATEDQERGNATPATPGRSTRETPKRSNSMRGRQMSSTSERLATNLLDNELSAALREVGFQKKESKPYFPVANSLGRATLSAALGLVTQVTNSAAALRDAAVESFEGGEAHTPSSSRRGSTKIEEGNDSDDEV